MISFYLGGVRSGKSNMAEQLARQSKLDVVYLATAQARDDEMRQRVALHREQRPLHWHLVEEPIAIASVLAQHSGRCVLVDCLSMWLTNCLLDRDSDCYPRERAKLLSALKAFDGELIFVSTEANMGVIPMGELSRRFCDELGLLHQAVAALSNTVTFSVAGLPHVLKDNT